MAGLQSPRIKAHLAQELTGTICSIFTRPTQPNSMRVHSYSPLRAPVKNRFHMLMSTEPTRSMENERKAFRYARMPSRQVSHDGSYIRTALVETCRTVYYCDANAVGQCRSCIEVSRNCQRKRHRMNNNAPPISATCVESSPHS